MITIVSGSLAYDRIMEFPSEFSEYILPERIDNLNVCFTVAGIKEEFGGTAGNIAYALRLMGEDPVISAAIGRDHASYLAWLRENRISTDLIKVFEKDYTAGAFITTDITGNQITVFNIGAMNNSSCLDFSQFDPGDTILIISPGNLDDMVNYPCLCKARCIRYIFDPGQQIPVIPPEELINSIEGCMILICNEYELDMIMNITGLGKRALLERAEIIIATKGEHGSKIITQDCETEIPAVKAKCVLDPTGAGDAYRGGLISGLAKGMDIRQSAILGSVCASFAVESYGTQEYVFTTDEFQKRLCEVCI